MKTQATKASKPRGAALQSASVHRMPVAEAQGRLGNAGSGAMLFQDRTRRVTSRPKPLNLFEALALCNDFRRARTLKEYAAVHSKWEDLRPHLVQYEKEYECDKPGDDTPLEFVIGLNDRVKWVTTLTKVVLQFVGQEKDELVDSLKDAFKDALYDAGKYGLKTGGGKVRPHLERTLTKMEACLIKYLRSLKKRSPKYYREILRAAGPSLEALGGILVEVGELISKPSKIAGELCGVLNDIDREDSNAFKRVFDVQNEQTAINVRPQLVVGRIDDDAEREAEATADRVMLMRDGGACCSACASGGPCVSHAEEIERGQVGPIRRQSSDNGGGLTVPADLEPQVRRTTSGGEALPGAVRAFFEPRLGQDLSHVRIHRDTDAAESTRGLGAKAYTLGSHIAFSAGRWAPGTEAGDRLIAHELAHATANGDGPIRRVVDDDDGTCLRGVMTPTAAGREAHKEIQAAARAFEFDTEAGIPKKSSRGVPRADLFGVWTEPEARRRGLPTTRTPENDTPWVIAEIGEIKPVSYAQGGIRHAQARTEIKDYLKYWKDFSKVPAIPMRSLRSIGPLEFMGSELFCDLDFPVDGLYIYQCSKSRDPKEATFSASVPVQVPKAVKRELQEFRDFEKLPAMTPVQARQHLASRMPMLLKWLRGLVISIGIVAAMAVVVALIASTAPLVAASAAAAVLVVAASGIERSHRELASS